MKRLPDWQLRFDDLIQRRWYQPFRWGAQDCAIFAADSVMAITGVDPAVGLRGLTARQACRALRGYGGLTNAVTQALGPPSHPDHAVEGDVMLMHTGRRPALAICAGPTKVIGPSRGGLLRLSRKDATLCWRVG